MTRKYLTTSIDRLRELFEVRDGKLYNRVDRGKARAGSLAGGTRHDGYGRVCVDWRRFLTHRVLFALVHGRWPKEDVDHIHGVLAGDDSSNLREATHADNMRNGKLRKNNRSGAPGVSWDKKRGKWHVTVRCAGKTHHFGRHNDFELAELIASEARHRLFGAFAPQY